MWEIMSFLTRQVFNFNSFSIVSEKNMRFIKGTVKEKSLSRDTDGNHATSILHCHWLKFWWRNKDYMWYWYYQIYLSKKKKEIKNIIVANLRSSGSSGISSFQIGCVFVENDLLNTTTFIQNCIYMNFRIKEFATTSNFWIPIYLQPDGVEFWYFKLRLIDIKQFIVWNI